MKFRLSRTIIMLIVILAFHSSEAFTQQSSSGQAESKEIAFLDIMVTESKPVILENKHVTSALLRLRHAYGCVISTEKIRHTRNERIRAAGNRWITKNRPLASRSFSNLTVRQILDELVRIDPGYHWKIYDGKYVVFEPRTEKYGGKEKSILDTIVSVSADDVSMYTLLSPYGGHPFGRELFYQHGLGFFQAFIGKVPKFDKILISVHLEDVTLRDAFNAIATAAKQATGDGVYWHIKGLEWNGTDKYRNVVTTRGFTFHFLRRE